MILKFQTKNKINKIITIIEIDIYMDYINILIKIINKRKNFIINLKNI